MKTHCRLLLVIFLASCSQRPTQPTPTTAASDRVATLAARAPSLEIVFDGNSCEVPQGRELARGEHVLLLHNQSDRRALLIVGRLYEGKRWEDFLEWFELHCGAPGSICDRTGEAPWVSWLFDEMSSDEGSATRYFLYDLRVEGQHLLIVSWLDGNSWPCGTFQVVSGA